LVESELIHGDCLIELPKIFDKKIDLILTDPPYGTTQCKWDSVIPFELMWNQLKRVIKDNGAIALFGSEPFSSYLRTSNIEWFKYDWIWEKDNSTGFANSKKQPMRKYENITIFYKKQPTYNPQMTVGKPYTIKEGIRKNSIKTLSGDKIQGKNKSNIVSYFRTKNNNFGTRYPINIINFKRERGLHPTQKPIALLEYLIKTYTNENDTVLDFTMGSGSTGVACKNLNRNFIGIEKDDKYFDIAKQRIFDLSKQRIEGGGFDII
jgi:DNA modification methylase